MCYVARGTRANVHALAQYNLPPLPGPAAASGPLITPLASCPGPTPGEGSSHPLVGRGGPFSPPPIPPPSSPSQASNPANSQSPLRGHPLGGGSSHLSRTRQPEVRGHYQSQHSGPEEPPGSPRPPHQVRSHRIKLGESHPEAKLHPRPQSSQHTVSPRGDLSVSHAAQPPHAVSTHSQVPPGQRGGPPLGRLQQEEGPPTTTSRDVRPTVARPVAGRASELRREEGPGPPGC